MQTEHHYKLTVQWTGNKGTGTSGYKDYERSHTILVENKPELAGSSDPAFRGDKTKHNPEDLLIAAVSCCHMLWYLHLCAVAGVVVTGNRDHATAIMLETSGGGGRFTEITLSPAVTLTNISMKDKAIELHSKAHELCYVANSLNFPVKHQPVFIIPGEE
jgi:organic hydroperoxide reductase OsmC/OhrA